MKKIGKMITELEERVDAINRVNIQLEKFKILINLAPEKKKKEIFRKMLKEFGLDKEFEKYLIK